MPGLPHADVTIDAEIVRSLMASSPWPAAETPWYWARGFDNEIWRVGHRAVRLPRRQEAVAALRTEQRWLNEAAGPLPVQSPAVLFAGEPTETFPYPWSITHFVDGRTGFDSSFDMRAASAESLATSLRALHRTAPPDAPHNPLRGVPLENRRENLQTRLAAVGPEHAAIVARHFERALTAQPFADDPVWIHGDVHLGNLIFDDQELVGLIDFSDLACGDPAVDLGGALLSLPYEAHERFWQSYGHTDRDLELRALGWAALLAVLHLQIEIAEHTVLAREALAWLASAD